MAKKESILVFAEQKNGVLHPVVFELLGKAQELAQGRMCQVEAVVLGKEKIALEELAYHGAQRIYHIQGEDFDLPDEILYCRELKELVEEISTDTLLLGATTFGRSLAPRLAAALETGLTADCTQLQFDEDGKLIQIRPAFSDHILAHIKSDTRPQMATIRYKEFKKGCRQEGKTAQIVQKMGKHARTKNITYEEIEKNTFDISNASIVVAGGRGFRSPEDLSLLRSLAQVMGAEMGASRAIVEEGYLPREHQVGYSGHRVKPRLYVACGISGAPQHLAGMKESDVIIAINSDPSAPIFQIADYGIVGDLYHVIPLLIKIMEKKRQAR